MALMSNLFGADGAEDGTQKPQQSPASVVKQGLQPNQPSGPMAGAGAFDPNTPITPTTISPAGGLTANPDPLAFSGTPLNAGAPATGPMGGAGGGAAGGGGVPPGGDGTVQPSAIQPPTGPNVNPQVANAPQLGAASTAPSGASWYDANGVMQNGAAAPAGVVNRPSATLNEAGTATDQATKTNPLAGYVSPEGGSFGLGQNAGLSEALRHLGIIAGTPKLGEQDQSHNQLGDLGTSYNAATGQYSGGDASKVGLGPNATADDARQLAIQLQGIQGGTRYTGNNTFLKAQDAYYNGAASPTAPPIPSSGGPPVQGASPTAQGPIAGSGVTPPSVVSQAATLGGPTGVAATGGSNGPTGGAQATPIGGAQTPLTAPAIAPFGGSPSSYASNARPTTTPTDPNNPLTNQTISAGPLADRFQNAQSQWDAFQKSSNPAYQAELRDANRTAAAGGALGSGQLQSHIGDIVNNRNTQLDSQRQSLLSSALDNSNNDAFRNAGVAQQQQGFQQSQQQQGFGNEVQRQYLQEQLKNGGFQRALQQLQAGNGGNPADVQLLLSKIFGEQATGAGNAAGSVARGQGQQAGSGNSQQQLISLLSSLFGGGK